MSWNEVQGILNLYKPAGVTSTDCVNLLKRFLRVRKIGHGGTLDPFAEGVLPIGINRGTKLLEHFLQGEKAYTGVFRLGYGTDTLDHEGTLLSRKEDFACPPQTFWVTRSQSLLGTWLQDTPAFSARKVEGKRLYALARKGETPAERPRKEVTIYEMEPTILAGGQLVRMDVACSKGTYVRQLVQDLIRPVDVPACLESLVRTRVGPLLVENSIAPAELLCRIQQGEGPSKPWFQG